MNTDNLNSAPIDIEAIRAQWIAEYEAIQARLTRAGGGLGTGVLKPEDAKGLTGIALMQAMLDGKIPRPSISETIDFGLVKVEPGTAIFQGTPQIKHLNPMGGIHGGWYATLLDSAVGCAVHTLMPIGRGYTTAELSVNIVRSATVKTGPLRAIGTVLHCGRQLATAEGKIVGPDGKLYAHATTTCLVFELPT
jgi:uncharacterized protein (TIGR00369 family)